MIVSDGGPQYTSAEFKDFTKQWQIEHKSLITKESPVKWYSREMYTDYEGITYQNYGRRGDMDLALLTYKTTPLSHRLPLPAELLNSRKYKTLFPTRIVPTRLQESLQIDHGPRKTNTGTAVQQEHQSAAKTQTVSKSCSAA